MTSGVTQCCFTCVKAVMESMWRLTITVFQQSFIFIKRWQAKSSPQDTVLYLWYDQNYDPQQSQKS